MLKPFVQWRIVVMVLYASSVPGFVHMPYQRESWTNLLCIGRIADVSYNILHGGIYWYIHHNVTFSKPWPKYAFRVGHDNKKIKEELKTPKRDILA